MVLFVLPLFLLVGAVILLVIAVAMSGIALLFGRWVMVAVVILCLGLAYSQWQSDVAYCNAPPTITASEYGETASFNCDAPAGMFIYTYLYVVEPIGALATIGVALWLWRARGGRASLVKRLVSRLSRRYGAG